MKVLVEMSANNNICSRHDMQQSLQSYRLSNNKSVSTLIAQVAMQVLAVCCTLASHCDCSVHITVKIKWDSMTSGTSCYMLIWLIFAILMHRHHRQMQYAYSRQ